MTSAVEERAALTENSVETDDFVAGYRLGFGVGRDVGYRLGVDDEGAAWTSIVTGWTESWRSPRHNELEALREPDHQPCPARCRRCSRCIHSLGWWARGGRPYAGIDQERALAGSQLVGAA